MSSREVIFKLGSLEITRRKARSVDWFVQFMRMAAEEDNASGGIAVNDVYEKISWINIAINARANNISRAPLRIYSGDTEIETGPFWQLLNAPNPHLSQAQLIQATEAWIGFLGESFWWLWNEAGRTGFPQRIYTLDPRKIEHVLNRDKMEVEVYKYHDDNGQIIPIYPASMIHFSTWNTKDQFRGQSPWAALGDEIYQTYHANRVNSMMLQNGAVPQGILTVPEALNEDEAKVLQERWEKRHQGSSRAGKVAVLSSGATFQPVALTPEDFQMHDLLAWNREAIFAKAGVPPAVAGISKDSTPLSGQDTADQFQQFWQLTLIPEQKFIQSKINIDLFARFGSKLTCEFDNSDIQELQEDEEKLHARARDDFKCGLLDHDEARELIGMDPAEPDQVFWMPFSVQPVSDNEPPEPEQPPVARSPEESPPQREANLGFEKKQTLTPEYKANHWRLLTRGWDAIEGKYRKKVRALFYEIGKQILTIINTKSAIGSKPFAPEAGETESEFISRCIEHHVNLGYDQEQAAAICYRIWRDNNSVNNVDRHNIAKVVEWAPRAQPLFEDEFWQKYGEEMAALSKRPLTEAMELTGGMVGTMFEDMGLGVSFDIYDTRAVLLLDKRLTKIKGVVDGTLRTQYQNALRTGMASEMTFDQISEEVRRIRDISQARADTIVRTEIGGVVNDARVASYLHEDFHYHQWGTALDDNVRDSHRIDGEIRHLGDPFSNGLMYPNDPNGAAEEVINCRCVTYPLTDAEAEAGGV